mmetsp:Transcript_591/g.1523  ORF Transcript_591/g.1523 Transcript_591/m.1523 type:complete len:325 (-) Transcript_591:142-1116(-)
MSLRFVKTEEESSIVSNRLELRLRVEQNIGVVDANITGGFVLCLDNDLVALLPHFDHQGVSRKNRLGKASLDGTELLRLAVAKCSNNSAGSDTQGAKTVENGLLEARHLGKVRFNVQRVVIATETVDLGLSLAGWHVHSHVRLTVRYINLLRVGCTRVLEVLGTDKEGARDNTIQSLAVGILYQILTLHRSTRSALVYANKASLDGELSSLRVKGRKLLDETFTIKTDLDPRQRRHRRALAHSLRREVYNILICALEGQYNGVSWESRKVIIVFIRKVQVLAANANSIQQQITLVVSNLLLSPLVEEWLRLHNLVVTSHLASAG